ncbi:MAG: hydroxymethylglutaryl-CoA lyase [Parasphingorhabdus sp.]|jgi:hydroxymethylglutaryl-CoA lyase
MVENVSVREVGLRDGLQLVENFLPTDTKLEWIQRQVDCGFADMEVTSFVPPAVIAQFADAESVLSGALKVKGLHAAVLVPNLKWGLRAMDSGARKINVVLSVSEAHNQANVRRSTDQSIQEFLQLVAERNSRGLQSKVEMAVSLATTFGCSLQGEVKESRVYEVAEQILSDDVAEVNLADTVGYGNPIQVKRIFSEMLNIAGNTAVAAHFHDTRGMGIANAVSALEAGVRRFDASLGGLGGCPFARGASGNIATEDSVYLMENLGLATGVNIERMLELRQSLVDWLPGELFEGKLLRAQPAVNFLPAA